ncbi:MAG TPA: 2-amino-4-hydroxy-6-hydroxymethyldihydropteridine diphosphokinase, partial [Firmicutes bacterium]|nr:2-amino-4-hydroxy-6-hydroxymethyldihydropteridine diphosphokinase [Bacillota bacterium]
MSGTAYVSLGSNIGNRLFFLRQSLKLLARDPAISLLAFSRVYETRPVGGPIQGLFLNAACSLKSSLPPVLLLRRLLAVEEKLGRERRQRWGPRTLDLDLLIYDKVVMCTPSLVLPHPRMVTRSFVLIPLLDIAPELPVPGTGQTVSQLCRDLEAAE